MIIRYIICLFFLSQVCVAQIRNYQVSKEIRVREKGVVVSAHPLASEAGASILRKGGNAFDAVVATQFALAVVYPQAGNIGGGGFLVGVDQWGSQFTIDYRETAPEKAHRDMYLDANGNANTHDSQYGHLASGVPGSVAGMFATLKYCKLPMKTLIQPAIELADKGFAITQREANLLNSLRNKFEKYNSFATVFVKNEPWKVGDILVQKDLESTLKRIQKLGTKGFYEGKTAQLIIQEMQKGKGLISLNDLKNYQVSFRKPLNFEYNGHQIITMSLPSSGGILLAQMLKMGAYANLSQFNLYDPQAVQIMVEAERRAYADRATYMGDPDFVKDPTNLLTSDSYLKNRWTSFQSQKASKSAEVGNVDIQQLRESTQTTHISVLDRFGNAASVTTTLNGLYGSKVVVEGAGFFMNNEMDDFSVKPGVPNMYGAVGGEANSIQPKKRMLSSMTPTIVLKNQQPIMVVGTPGGTTIPTSVYQAIVNVLDFGLDPNLAINAPKFHHQWLPEVVYVEPHFPDFTIQSLEKMGYKIKKREPIGRTEIILKLKDGSLDAVADGRGDDAVAVE